MGILDMIFGKKEKKEEQGNLIPIKSASSEPTSATSVQWSPVANGVLPRQSGVINIPSVYVPLIPLKIPFTNSINYLDPRMAIDFPAFTQKVKDVGLNIGISCTARLMKCQVALYAQGRQPLAEINRLRKLAGMDDISLTQSKKIVTWTLFSKHLVNYDDNDPNNDYSQAFDFYVLDGKKATWDVKCNVNNNKIDDYEEVGYIATKHFGWVWGGNWKKNRDFPHIELKV